MDRLARLATGGPKLRPQLMDALEALEKSHDYSQLPALFATNPGDAKELAYLDDALATSLDQLIRDASPDARRLLWMIALANEPVMLALLKSVWSGESLQEQQSAAPARPDPEPLLRHLVAVGLATEERAGPDDDNPDLTCHELVRERIRRWMSDHETDRANLTENAIRLAYAERLVVVFDARLHEDMTTALQAGSRALVYCVQAGAWDRLGGFASGLVTSARDPRLLEGLLPHLETAAESAPEGMPRRRCLGYLPDAMWRAGHPDASLRFYEQAAKQARTDAKAGGEDASQAWQDLAWITFNWANALRETGDLDAARERLLRECRGRETSGHTCHQRHRQRTGSPAHRLSGPGRRGAAAGGGATGAGGGLVASASLGPVRAGGPGFRVPNPRGYQHPRPRQSSRLCPKRLRIRPAPH
jgi:hypothetical protein